MPEVREIWDALRSRLGRDLRVVTHYDATDFETIMRDDLREEYTSVDDREIVDDTILQQQFFEKSADAFAAGSLEGAVRVFESAYVLAYPHPRERKAGFLVSIERGKESMCAVETALQLLDEKVGEESA